LDLKKKGGKLDLELFFSLAVNLSLKKLSLVKNPSIFDASFLIMPSKNCIVQGDCIYLNPVLQ